jgi:hypothetical protein
VRDDPADAAGTDYQYLAHISSGPSGKAIFAR